MEKRGAMFGCSLTQEILIVNLQALGTLIRKDLAYFGVRKTVYDIFLRSVNRVVFIKVFNAILLERVDPEYSAIEPPLEWRLLNTSQLEEFANNPEYDITEEFLASAIEKGDECFGVFVGGVLGSYSWCSSQSTENSDGLTVSFNSEYAYVYKGFTHLQYRGQHLHAIGMTLALREYLSRGYKGLVAYVESNNFSSLKSFYHLGHRDIGCIVVWKLFGWPIIVARRGCRKVGICFEPTKSPEQMEMSSDSHETADVSRRPSGQAIGRN
jgi:hypothetical protein